MQNTLLDKFKLYLKLKDYSLSCFIPTRIFLEYCSKNNIDIYNIGYEDLSKYVLSLKERLKNTSINLYIASIKLFYKFLKDTNEPIRPEIEIELSKIRGLKIDRVIKQTINFKQIDELIEKALSYDFNINPYKLKAILYFMFYTGVRKNELIGLKRENINLEEKTALIKVPTKNKKERFVFFPCKVESILRKYFTDEPEYINAFNLTESQIVRIFIFLKNFIPKISPHLLRHSFTQLLAYKGIDIRVAQELLGHKSLQSTMIYYNPNTETVRKLYREKIK